MLVSSCVNVLEHHLILVSCQKHQAAATGRPESFDALLGPLVGNLGAICGPPTPRPLSVKQVLLRLVVSSPMFCEDGPYPKNG
jgi:hypothetical protein